MFLLCIIIFLFFLSHLYCHCSYRPQHFYYSPFFFSLSNWVSAFKEDRVLLHLKGTYRPFFSCPEEKDNYSPFFIPGIMTKWDWYLFWNYYSRVHKSCSETPAHVANLQAHYCRKYILNSLLSFNFGSSWRSFRFITRTLLPILIFGTEKC